MFLNLCGKNCPKPLKKLQRRKPATRTDKHAKSQNIQITVTAFAVHRDDAVN